MYNSNITANELAAALVLVKSCLNGMGGKRPSDLDNDPYTWVSAKDLMAAGWTAAEANGTFGALIEKGFIDTISKTEWALRTEAYQYLDTIWGANQAPAEKENAVTTSFVALIDLANLTVAFAADHPAEDTDLFTAGSAPELEDLSGPQSVAIYNVLVAELNAAPAREGQDPVPTTKRFADKGTATKRVWGLIEQVWELRDPNLPADVAQGYEESGAEDQAQQQAEADAATAVKSKKADAPVKTTTAPRRGTGINLAPQKKVYACREGSKQATLVDMLFRKQGATMAELLDALSGGAKPWKEVTVKSGLNWDMNKIKGYGIRTTKRGDDDCYHLVLPEGMTAPVPHTPKKGA